jgi:hypothetical protein
MMFIWTCGSSAEKCSFSLREKGRMRGMDTEETVPGFGSLTPAHA